MRKYSYPSKVYTDIFVCLLIYEQRGSSLYLFDMKVEEEEDREVTVTTA